MYLAPCLIQVSKYIVYRSTFVLAIDIMAILAMQSSQLATDITIATCFITFYCDPQLLLFYISNFLNCQLVSLLFMYSYYTNLSGTQQVQAYRVRICFIIEITCMAWHVVSSGLQRCLHKLLRVISFKKECVGLKDKGFLITNFLGVS